jgi:hypothetical protein
MSSTNFLIETVNMTDSPRYECNYLVETVSITQASMFLGYYPVSTVSKDTTPKQWNRNTSTNRLVSNN